MRSRICGTPAAGYCSGGAVDSSTREGDINVRPDVFGTPSAFSESAVGTPTGRWPFRLWNAAMASKVGWS